MLTKTFTTAFTLAAIFMTAGWTHAGETFDERIIPVFDDREWVAANAGATREQVLAEYVPKGDGIDEWSELVTTVLVPVEFKEGVISALKDYYQGNIQKQCSEANWETLSISDTMIVCAWDLEPCLDSGAEYTLTVFKKGVRFAHMLMYAARDKKVFEEQMPKWVQLLTKARAFAPEDSGLGPHVGHLADSARMIRISYRYDSPTLANDDFMRQPRKIWRSGSKYFRSEEMPDSARGIHGLMITSEPDAWIANLMNMEGRHLVDQGPTFNTVCPVFGEVRQDGLSTLEFGLEQKFFEHHAARQLPDETVDGIECKVFELPRLYWVLRLYVSKATNLPYLVTRRGPDNSTDSVYYDSYEVDLDLNRELFEPPNDVEFTDG